MPNGEIRTGSEIGVDEEPVTTQDGIVLFLDHHVRNGSEHAERSVLLLHGASAASRTFQIPREHNLIGFLLGEGRCDVWTLDWRASNRVSPNHADAYDKFTLDRAAKLDLPRALVRIQERNGEKPVSVFAHCMGGGSLAMAIGAGWIGADRVDRVVLSTLGLFYQVPWDGWVKAEDEMLERIRGEQPELTSVDCDATRKAWPDVIEKAYERWPSTLLPPEGNEIFRRLSFMFGRPYRPDLLPEEVHREDELRSQFGEIPLKLYIHCCQNVRRGFAAPFDEATDIVPGEAPAGGTTGGNMEAYLNVERFRGIGLTLITGSRNELWHPDAVHRMYDWLRRGLGPKECTKRTFEGYAHQDLLWGKAAPDDVYPTIASGLGLS